MADTKYAVEITARTTQFESALNAAGRTATATASKIDKAFGSLRTAINSNAAKLVAGLGAIGGVAAFSGLIKGSIDAADHLNDLSRATGIAVETLGGIGFAAEQSGSDLDETAKAVQRLNLKIAEATAGNEAAVNAFRLVGISVDELKRTATTDVLVRLADQFRSYEGGANKAALGTAFFSKAYSGIAPLLDDGGDKLRENIEYFQRYGGITKETAAKADEFNDTLVKLKLINGQFARAIAGELLPSLQTLADRLVETKEKGQEFKQFAGDVASVLKGIATAAIYGTTQFVAYGRALGAIGAQAAALAQFDLDRVRAIQSEIEHEQEERFKQMNALIDAINNPQSAKDAKPPGKLAGTRGAPSLGSSDADASRKKLFEQQIKDFEDQVRQERDILRARESFLKRAFDDELLGIGDYFRTRQQFMDDALAAELRFYDEEIAAAQAFAAKAGPKERVDAEERLADIVAKRAKAQQDASIATVHNFLDQQKAAEGFRDKLEEIAIAFAEARGDTVAAGLAEFDRSNAEFARLTEQQLQSLDEIERREGEIARKVLDDRRTQVAQQLQLNRAQEDFALILQRVSIAQGSADAQRAAGALTELEFLSKLSAVTASQLDSLRQVADEYERVARISGDPRALVQAEALRVEIERLAASTDLVARKFNDIAEGAFADFVTDVVTGTKTVSQAFRDMERAIFQSITRIAAQNIAEKLFGKEGVGSIFGDILGLLFSAGGASSGSGFGMNVRANGGPVAANTPYLVGETGPELFVPKSAGTIVPNRQSDDRDRGVGGFQQIVNIAIQGSTNAATAHQIAREVAIATGRAARR